MVCNDFFLCTSLLSFLQTYQWLIITTWGHDPSVVAASNVLLALNDALAHSAVLLQVCTCGVTCSGVVLFFIFYSRPLLSPNEFYMRVCNFSFFFSLSFVPVLVCDKFDYNCSVRWYVLAQSGIDSL